MQPRQLSLFSPDRPFHYPFPSPRYQGSKRTLTFNHYVGLALIENASVTLSDADIDLVLSAEQCDALETPPGADLVCIDPPSVVRDFEIFLQEKYRIASDTPGSGNTKSSGSTKYLDRLLSGSGVLPDWA